MTLVVSLFLALAAMVISYAFGQGGPVVALTGGAVLFGVSSLVMAVVGLLVTSRLMPRAKRAGNFSRGFPTRRLNIAFAAISAGGFSLQLGLAVALLASSHSAALQRAL